MRRLLCIASTQLACWAAQAAGLHVLVQDREGRPLPEAVVVLYPAGAAAPASPAPAGAVLIGQERMRFTPALTVVVPGTRLRFANLDRWDHHVRGTLMTAGLGALDPNAPPGFEFRLAGQTAGQPPVVTELVLDQPGIVLLGCHLHGSMRGHVFVTDSAWTLKTDESGMARFDGLPSGALELRVWHPELLIEPPRQALRLGATTLQQTVQLGVVARRRRL